MSSNENPLGLSDAARTAIAEGLDEANRYPGEWRRRLVAALATKHQVKPEQIVLGNGSTEVLQMVVQSAGADATVIVADPTFEDVPRYAERIGVRVEKVPLASGYTHDLTRMHDIAARAAGRVLVYICNPNNPTGTVTPSADLDRWIGSAPEQVTFAVDEAYFEYASGPSYWSAQQWIETHPNVIVVRTFSKIYAMAGMRLGYAIAHPDAAERLERYSAGNNANQLALAAGLASLGDDAFAEKSLAVNREGLQALYRCLEELDLEYLPSQTNFVMHRIQGDLATYNGRMRERGILVGRPFPPMLAFSRVSVGLPQEMRVFTEALRSFRQQGWV
ncbi:MAG: aminotransferase class I/II-fold pyridoxal phosphate-dependent enzyme [Gemmatimonadetes bacterium]|nr:aminotransferase class I/II-fold pyridoxal phosphate-dependent enzyme [Gemmatimonadota bacterium]